MSIGGIAAIVAAGVAATAAGFVGWGAMLPRETRAERSAVLNAPVTKVFALVTDVAGQSAWRSDIGTIEMAADGHRWTEVGRDGSRIDFTLVRKEQDRLFEIAYRSDRGFEGGWIGTFAPADGGTQVRFDERVTVASPFTRALARLIAPPGKHLDLYLADLRAKVAPGR